MYRQTVANVDPSIAASLKAGMITETNGSLSTIAPRESIRLRQRMSISVCLSYSIAPWPIPPLILRPGSFGRGIHWEESSMAEGHGHMITARALGSADSSQAG